MKVGGGWVVEVVKSTFIASFHSLAPNASPQEVDEEANDHRHAGMAQHAVAGAWFPPGVVGGQGSAGAHGGLLVRSGALGQRGSGGWPQDRSTTWALARRPASTLWTHHTHAHTNYLPCLYYGVRVVNWSGDDDDDDEGVSSRSSRACGVDGGAGGKGGDKRNEHKHTTRAARNTPSHTQGWEEKRERKGCGWPACTQQQEKQPKRDPPCPGPHRLLVGSPRRKGLIETSCLALSAVDFQEHPPPSTPPYPPIHPRPPIQSGRQGVVVVSSRKEEAKEGRSKAARSAAPPFSTW